MRRREFIVLLTGAAVGSPLAALAQRGERVRRIRVLIPFSQSDPETQALLAAFLQRVKELGWTDGATHILNIGIRMEIQNVLAPQLQSLLGSRRM